MTAPATFACQLVDYIPWRELFVAPRCAPGAEVDVAGVEPASYQETSTNLLAAFWGA